MFQLRRFIRQSGVDEIGDWLKSLPDCRARARIEARLTRLSLGHFGDCKPIAEGVWELRIDAGPGYRIYYAMQSKVIIVLLCGGDKRTQQRDIKRAIAYWRELEEGS